MFAFKATNKDMTYLGFQYELDKLYEIEGELKLCDNGFHFCKNLKDIDRYYPFYAKDNRYFVVEIPDDAEIINSRDKSVANKIKFIRELTEQDWIDNNMIREVTDKSFHWKNSDGIEKWSEYDDQGNEIHYKNSNGLEKWYEYNEQGKIIYFKNSSGTEEWWEYDDQGNEIHYKDSSGFEQWWKYDDQGNMIHYKNSDELEEWWEYDDQGNEIYYKNSDGIEESY